MTTDLDPGPEKGRPIRLTPVAPGVWLVLLGGGVTVLGPLFGFLIGNILWTEGVALGMSPIFLFLFLGFLVARGFYERKATTILLSLFVAWVFGGALWGLLPFVTPGISWQSHLGGFVGGILAARTVANWSGVLAHTWGVHGEFTGYVAIFVRAAS